MKKQFDKFDMLCKKIISECKHNICKKSLIKESEEGYSPDMAFILTKAQFDTKSANLPKGITQQLYIPNFRFMEDSTAWGESSEGYQTVVDKPYLCDLIIKRTCFKCRCNWKCCI